jgi:predicted amidophosphoribosyltransferase
LKDIVKTIPIFRIDVICQTTPPTHLSLPLTEAMNELMEQLKRNKDYIIFRYAASWFSVALELSSSLLMLPLYIVSIKISQKKEMITLLNNRVRRGDGQY